MDVIANRGGVWAQGSAGWRPFWASASRRLRLWAAVTGAIRWATFFHVGLRGEGSIPVPLPPPLPGESNCNPTFCAFSSSVITNRPKFLGWPAGQRSVAALFPIIYSRLAPWALLRSILTILEARRFHEPDGHLHPLNDMSGVPKVHADDERAEAHRERDRDSRRLA